MYITDLKGCAEGQAVPIADIREQAQLKYVAFQGMMQINSVINWFLNIVFDVIVLKMISVYSVFNAENRQEATHITRKSSARIQLFIIVYGFCGMALNYLSWSYLQKGTYFKASGGAGETTPEDETALRAFITAIGVCLFVVDMVLLVLFYKCISNILEHYQKDYQINKCAVWSIIATVSLTYIIEMVWSDLFMWGGLLNPLTSLKLAGRVHVSAEFVVYTVMTINAILSNYYQGLTILVVFNHFAQKKYNYKKKCLQQHSDYIKTTSAYSSSIRDVSNTTSLYSLLQGDTESVRRKSDRLDVIYEDLESE